MADSKLSALSAAASLATTDLFYVVQAAGSGGVKATLSQLGTLYAGLGANTFTDKQTITIGAANTGVLASTGYSVTGSAATTMADFSGTWNTSGNPVALKIAIAGTASVGDTASSFLLKMLGGAAGTTTYFSFGADGNFKIPLGNAYAANFISAGNLSIGTSVGSPGDVILVRDAAGTLAQRNGANAQTMRIYGTYTDASNYERAAIKTTAGSKVEFAAETAGTGGDNLDVALTPAGTGGVTLGANYQQFTEMTAPAAGATNNVRIYAEDNGSGKTRLMALFPTGAAQQIAIEP